MSKTIKTLAVVTIVAGCASGALAQSPPPYSGGYGAYGPPPPSPVAPYGDANPSYTDYYGTYPPTVGILIRTFGRDCAANSI